MCHGCFIIIITLDLVHVAFRARFQPQTSFDTWHDIGTMHLSMYTFPLALVGKMGPCDAFLNTNTTQMVKHDMCVSLRPSMLAISHLGHVLKFVMITLGFLSLNIDKKKLSGHDDFFGSM